MNFCDLRENCNSCCCDDGPSLLSELSGKSREYLYDGKQEIRYSKGETVIKQHTRVNHLVCLKKGYLKVYSEGLNGKNLVRKILKPGEMIGGMGMFVDENHHFSCTALTEVECCLINVEKFKHLLTQDHQMCLNLIKRVNQFAVNSSEKMLNLVHKTMQERVSDMILYLSDNIYKKDSFEPNISRQDMADLCSLSKESVIRILKDFKEQEIISIESNIFTIKDKAKLLNISKSLVH